MERGRGLLEGFGVRTNVRFWAGSGPSALGLTFGNMDIYGPISRCETLPLALLEGDFNAASASKVSMLRWGWTGSILFSAQTKRRPIAFTRPTTPTPSRGQRNWQEFRRTGLSRCRSSSLEVLLRFHPIGGSPMRAWPLDRQSTLNHRHGRAGARTSRASVWRAFSKRRFASIAMLEADSPLTAHKMINI